MCLAPLGFTFLQKKEEVFGVVKFVFNLFKVQVELLPPKQGIIQTIHKNKTLHDATDTKSTISINCQFLLFLTKDVTSILFLEIGFLRS